jgi:hypothetical protein
MRKVVLKQDGGFFIGVKNFVERTAQGSILNLKNENQPTGEDDCYTAATHPRWQGGLE